MATLEEVDIREVIQPNKFSVTPIRRINPTHEVAQVLEIESGLPGLADDPDLIVTPDNVDRINENVIIAVKVNDSWARASITNKLCMSWGVGNPRYIELDVFLIDWGYSVKILDIVGHVRFLPETSGFGQVEGLASRVSIDCLAALAIEPNEQLKIVYVPTEKWSVKAMEMVKDLVDDADQTYLEFQMKGDKKIAFDIQFVFGQNRRHVKHRYGNFELVLDDCLTPDGRVSLKNLLITGKFAILIDPDNTPIKKEHGIMTIYHDDWESIWESPRGKPRRTSRTSASSILNSLPQTPDHHAELERQRRYRDQRRKERASRKVLERRNPKNGAQENKIVVLSSNEVDQIREVNETKAIEQTKIVYRPHTLGRGVRRDQIIIKSDEHIGLKRQHLPASEMVKGQFHDDDGPFLEENFNNWTMMGDVNQKLKKTVTVLTRAPFVGRWHQKNYRRQFSKYSNPVSNAAHALNLQPSLDSSVQPSEKPAASAKPFVPLKQSRFLDVHDLLERKKKERQMSCLSWENSSFLPSNFIPLDSSSVKEDYREKEVSTASYLTAQEPSNLSSKTASIEGSPPAAQLTHISDRDYEEIRDSEICVTHSTTPKVEASGSVVVGMLRLHLQTGMIAFCDANSDNEADNSSHELLETKFHREVDGDAVQTSSDNRESDTSAKSLNKEEIGFDCEEIAQLDEGQPEQPIALDEEDFEDTLLHLHEK